MSKKKPRAGAEGHDRFCSDGKKNERDGLGQEQLESLRERKILSSSLLVRKGGGPESSLKQETSYKKHKGEGTTTKKRERCGKASKVRTTN